MSISIDTARMEWFLFLFTFFYSNIFKRHTFVCMFLVRTGNSSIAFGDLKSKRKTSRKILVINERVFTLSLFKMCAWSIWHHFRLKWACKFHINTHIWCAILFYDDAISDGIFSDDVHIMLMKEMLSKYVTKKITCKSKQLTYNKS